MRKFLISAAIAASSLAVAAPAAAQWAPAPQYGYNGGYGGGYGYNNNYGQVRSLQARIDNLQRQIVMLDRRNILSDREARGLMNESQGLEYRLRRSAQFGLNWNESRDIQYRIARLEQRVQREAMDGNRRGDRRYSYANGYNNGAYGWVDRDRDGRNDRYEDDRGRDRDD